MGDFRTQHCSKCGAIMRRANIPPQTKLHELHAYDCPSCHHRCWIERSILSR